MGSFQVLTKNSKFKEIAVNSNLSYRLYYNDDCLNLVRQNLSEGVHYKNYVTIPYEIAGQIGHLLIKGKEGKNGS